MSFNIIRLNCQTAVRATLVRRLSATVSRPEPQTDPALLISLRLRLNCFAIYNLFNKITFDQTFEKSQNRNGAFDFTEVKIKTIL